MVKSLKASSISYSLGTIKIRALYSTLYMNVIYKVDNTFLSYKLFPIYQNLFELHYSPLQKLSYN